MAKFEIRNWDLQTYRDALEKAYWLLHAEGDHNRILHKDGNLEVLKHLAYLNGSISLRITKYHLQLNQNFGEIAHTFIGERMATIELNDDKLNDVIAALDKGALSVGIIDRMDGRSVDLLRQLKTKIEEAKRAQGS